MMDELAQARTELAQLQSTERALVQQLLAVRVAVETQKCKISELAKAQPSLVDRLPIELVTRIFSFVLMCNNEDPRLFLKLLRKRRKILARVSPFWRELVCNTPSFWSDVGLTRSSRPKSFLRRLKRSRECPLHVTILNAPGGSEMDTLLDILLASTNRWRTLRVQGITQSVLSDLLHKFNQFEFPCLEDVSIDLCGCDYPQFLSPARSPSLRHLDLLQLNGTVDFSTATTTLTTLGLSISAIRDQLFLTGIATQSLTTLTFTDVTSDRGQDWFLERNSLRFPLLQRLVLDAIDPYRFMDAVVAPKLEYIEYIHHPDSVPGTFAPKFGHVRHFTFKSRNSLSGGIHLNESQVQMLCQTFSGVRHASLPASHINNFFADISAFDASELRTPVDSWENLEQLSLICDCHDWDWHIDTLVEWFTPRQKLGRPSLHVEVSGSQDDWQMAIEDFSYLYSQLRDCCVLDFKGLQLSHTLRLSTDGGFLHVRVDDENSIVLNNWREISLENLDPFWLGLLNERQSFSQTADAGAVGDLVELLLILARACE